MSMLPITGEFVAYLVDERHFDPNTARCYCTDLHQYFDFLTDKHGITVSIDHEMAAFDTIRAGQRQHTSVETDASPSSRTLTELICEANVETVRAFLDSMSTKQYSAATTARKIAALRSFYRWAKSCGYSSDNPMLTIHAPAPARFAPKVLSADDINRLLSAPDSNTVLGLRDRAILETLYMTGVRISELVRLTRGNIGQGDQTLRISCKSRRERVIRLGPRILETIWNYLNALRADPRFSNVAGQDENEAPLFVNKHGGRISMRSIRRMVSKYVKRAGLDLSSSPRALRQSLTAHLLGKGVKVHTVQELLGHISTRTTAHYAKLPA